MESPFACQEIRRVLRGHNRETIVQDELAAPEGGGDGGSPMFYGAARASKRFAGAGRSGAMDSQC